jgi:hypothetical protein
MNCLYFGGLGQGTAHECVWEEPVDISLESYRMLAEINPFEYKTYYAKPPEYKPKDIS